MKKAFYMFIELILRVVISPYFRASVLRIFGAKIGRNVRIYEIKLINLDSGFSNLEVGSDVHIGTGCCIDLKARVNIGDGTVISPNVTILTHSDPGSYHGSPICNFFPPFEAEVLIKEHCWIGANSTILAGSVINAKAVVGACSLVRGKLDGDSLYIGVPVKKVKSL
ncbi:acyltransferase [Pseudothauera hydrothermalis]|uniref:acyltransferase n=1 Tax=Pseudothauera hydrothermalis TaxID=2184083 RepID=UPI00131EE212|nr:acyltransferase [Pseudothauera hydrothermalis]